MTEFTPFPKIPRLSREVVITEKIDGTNACVNIDYCPDTSDDHLRDTSIRVGDYLVKAGSRSRFIVPGKTTDNFGFAAWVWDNAEELVKLGAGTHYGEWWGAGIQRRYGLEEKRFSLFNVGRWSQPGTVHLCDVLDGLASPPPPTCCSVVPVLWTGLFSTESVDEAMYILDTWGSRAAPGFMTPEGVMIYHTAAKQYFKKTFEGDAAGKEAA